MRDHVEVLRALLKHDGVDVNIMNNQGSTALDRARNLGKAEAIRLLMQHMKLQRRRETDSPSANSPWPRNPPRTHPPAPRRNENSPSSEDCSVEDVNELLQHDTARRHENSAPSDDSSVEVAQAVLENDNVEVNATFYLASQNGHDEVVRLLLQHHFARLPPRLPP